MTSIAGAARAAEILLGAAARRNCLRAGTLLIDNEDGIGERDYSAAVLGDSVFRIERRLNEPSRFVCDLLVAPEGLPVPQRRARVVVKSRDGRTLFTGYLATEPIRVHVGGGSDRSVFRAKLDAISDEWLLDKLGPASLPSGGLSLGLNVRQAIESLTRQYGDGGLSVIDGGTSSTALSALALAKEARWSVQAGTIATAAYATYRALNGAITLRPAGFAIHDFSEADGSLSIADFRVSQRRELANDVTISGELEPTTHVTDIFLGDGVTTDFALSEPAFHAAHPVLLQDDFTAATLDERQWIGDDPGGHLSLTSAGLTMNGGNGVDGSTTLDFVNAIEIGGTLLVELRGVKLGANSVGVLGGMYTGDVVLANCFAGFRVRQNGGVTVLVPVISGVEVGTVYTVAEGHGYTLRLRLHCAETQRVMQRYNAMVDGVVQTFGDASAINAPMDVVFDLIDEGQGSANPATVLYDSAAAGAVVLTPAICAFAAINSGQIFGSIGSVAVTQTGTLWVKSTHPNGAEQTKLMGAPYTGVDCSASAGSSASGPGTVKFFQGRQPEAGELIRVQYRMSGRALARVIDAASVSAEAAAGAPGTSRWLGKVLQPTARSSADCETAAQAILAFSTSRSAALAGTYTCINPASDIWPGDVLRITSGGVTTPLLVRAVTIEDSPALAKAA